MPNLLRWFALPCCLIFFSACENDDKEEIIPDNTIRRTVLMYVSAQNSLGYKNFQNLDSLEIVKGKQYIQDNDCLLVYVDDENHPRIYRYTKDKHHPEILRSWTKDVNSSSPDVLKDVLSWTKEKFPSTEYGLVMWSHSDGWLPSTNKKYNTSSSLAHTLSFGIDVGEGGEPKYDQDKDGNMGPQMDIDDMAAAIQKSNIHLKYIFFDSCLMQNLEVAYSLKNITDFIIAAPIQIPGCGANYTHMLQKGLFTNAEFDIVDTYTTDATEGFSNVENEYYDYGIVISSLRTDKLEALAKMTAEVLKKSDLTNRKSIDLQNAPHYQAYSSSYFYRPHNYDAQEVMKRILSKENFNKFSKALNEAIITKGATNKFWIGPSSYTMQTVDLNNYCGVSMFIPQDIYTRNADNCIFGDLNQAFQNTGWYHAAGWKVTGW